jgi:hypothetical protein|tara:strand:+ start:1253 stop:1723 length:471 start_codon:yes stop_codon:yes gene_type:complete
MHVTISGGSKSQKKYVRSVAKFCVTKLMPRLVKSDLHLKIKLSKLKSEELGYCLPLVDDGDRADRPRYFEIELNSKLILRKLLVALCHEIVHVKQFAQGELYDSMSNEKTRWQGKWIVAPEYWERPWEWAAYGREYPLFIKWCETNDIRYKWAQES